MYNTAPHITCITYVEMQYDINVYLIYINYYIFSTFTRYIIVSFFTGVKSEFEMLI